MTTKKRVYLDIDESSVENLVRSVIDLLDDVQKEREMNAYLRDLLKSKDEQLKKAAQKLEGYRHALGQVE